MALNYFHFGGDFASLGCLISSHYLLVMSKIQLKINKIKLPNDEIRPFPHHQEHIIQGFGDI
jgi:hypothetical protein